MVKGRILVVDDNKSVLSAIEMLLQPEFELIESIANPNRIPEKLRSGEYDLVLRTNDGTLELGQISGGERVQLALALRIALIELISPAPLLIIDEPFGSLDQDHRELLGESLNKIGSLGQLITVTHIPVQSLQLEKRLDLGGY